MTTMQCVLDVQAKLAECPRWDERTQTLYFVDIDSFKLHAYHLESKKLETRTFDEEIGCFSLTEGGGFIAAFRSGVYVFDDLHSSLQPYWLASYNQKTTRFNDGRCDAKGRFFAGTMYSPKDAFNGALHQFSQGKESLVDQSVWTSNGLAFSPDNSIMYYSDTPNHVVYQFDYDLESGTASNKRIFIEFPRGNGRPDGGAVDVEGNYWTALYQGQRVAKINPAGDILEEFPVPATYPTMVAFGGPNMDTLFVSTCRAAQTDEELTRFPQAGGIFAIKTNSKGQIESRFAG